jgi:hypothetical protein
MTLDNIKDNKKRNIAVILSIVIAISAAIFPYVITNHESQAERNATDGIKMVDVQWQGYAQLGNLTSDADAIIVGKVVTDKGDVGGSIPQTDFEVRVEQILKGDFKPGDKITVRQLGSTSDNVFVDSDVMMNTGDQYLFFLGYSHTIADVYYSLGGPQGRFPIQNGMVSSMDQISSQADFVMVKEKNKPINDFLAEISVKINEVKSK